MPARDHAMAFDVRRWLHGGRQDIEREEADFAVSSLRGGSTVPLSRSLWLMRGSTPLVGRVQRMLRRDAGSQRLLDAIRTVVLDVHGAQPDRKKRRVIRMAGRHAEPGTFESGGRVSPHAWTHGPRFALAPLSLSPGPVSVLSMRPVFGIDSHTLPRVAH